MSIPDSSPDHDSPSSAAETRKKELGVLSERIFAYEPIRKSEKLKKLLDFLLQHLKASDGSHIDQYRIAFDCFGMDSSFDAMQSALVRVHLSKLRKVLLAYAEGPGKGESFKIVLPKGSYALEIIDSPDSTFTTNRPVLALMEFKSIGLENEWRMLPSLLSEQLAGRISRASTFSIMGPFSRSVIGHEDPDLCAIASKFGIDCFVDGYIHKTHEGFELGLRIVEGATGCVTWSASETLPLHRLSLVGIDDELLRKLESMIGADFGGMDAHFSRLARAKSPSSLTVYEAVLLGRMYFAEFNPRILPVAIGRLREVVREFPEEPLPKATLAMLLANAGHEPRWEELPPVDEICSLAADAWRMAPDEPWSILAFGFAACFRGDEFEIRRLGRAVEADRDAAAIAKCGMGVLLCLRNIDTELGLRLIRECRRLNPYQPTAVHVVEALIALRSGDLDAAIRHLDTYRVPWGWADPLIRAAAHVLRGEMEPAADEYRSAVAAFPDLEIAARQERRLVWHRDHMEFLLGTCANAGIAEWENS